MLCATPGLAQWFGPDNYEECLEHYIEPGQGVFAAQLLQAACETEFLRTESVTPRQKQYIDCLRTTLQDKATNKDAYLAKFSCGQKHLKYIP